MGLICLCYLLIWWHTRFKRNMNKCNFDSFSLYRPWRTPGCLGMLKTLLTQVCWFFSAVGPFLAHVASCLVTLSLWSAHACRPRVNIQTRICTGYVNFALWFAWHFPFILPSIIGGIGAGVYVQVSEEDHAERGLFRALPWDPAQLHESDPSCQHQLCGVWVHEVWIRHLKMINVFNHLSLKTPSMMGQNVWVTKVFKISPLGKSLDGILHWGWCPT